MYFISAGNQANGDGGVVYLSKNAELTIETSTFTGDYTQSECRITFKLMY